MTNDDTDDDEADLVHGDSELSPPLSDDQSEECVEWDCRQSHSSILGSTRIGLVIVKYILVMSSEIIFISYQNTTDQGQFYNGWSNVEDQSWQHEADTPGSSVNSLGESSGLTIQMESCNEDHHESR